MRLDVVEFAHLDERGDDGPVLGTCIVTCKERILSLQGFVARNGLSSELPLPQTDLAYGDGTRYAKSCEAI